MSASPILTISIVAGALFGATAVIVVALVSIVGSISAFYVGKHLYQDNKITEDTPRIPDKVHGWRRAAQHHGLRNIGGTNSPHLVGRSAGCT